MKRILRISVFIAACIICRTASADSASATEASHASNNQASGYTFYVPRPYFASAMPERETMFRPEWAFAKECGIDGAFQAVLFGGGSTRAAQLGTYFMFGGKNTLIVDSSSSDLARDINPSNFGIDYVNGEVAGSYSSVISFRPRETVIGLGLDYRQFFGCSKQWYFEISTPITYVRNEMKFTESDVVTVGTPVANTNTNMIDAFAAKFPIGLENMLYGLITDNDENEATFGTLTVNSDNTTATTVNGKRKRTGLGNIEIRLGYQYYDEPNFHIDGYMGIITPGARKAHAKYVFDAVVGNNGHWGVMVGGSTGYEFWRCGERSLRWEIASCGRYFFSGTETRSFDLRYRPWSRYMRVYATEAAAALDYDGGDGTSFANVQPAINVLTQKVKITPRCSGDVNIGLVYNQCSFYAEVGYNGWARQAEHIKLKNAWEVGPAIASTSNFGLINRLSNIGNSNNVGNGAAATIGADIQYTTAADAIQEQDLNLQSAAHPAALSNAIYLSLGYAWDEWCWPTFIDAGASYEFSGVNTALSRWLVWGKVGVAF